MSGFAVYTTDADPQCLYTDGDLPEFVDETVSSVVETGDRPLDLYLDGEAGLIVWSFKARRLTTSARTGYFIAAYHTEEGDLFDGLATALGTLDDQAEWEVSRRDDLRWDAGFALADLEAAFPPVGPDPAHLGDELKESVEPIVVDLPEYGQALQLIRAVTEENPACTVVVSGTGLPTSLEDVDLVLRPTAPESTADSEPYVSRSNAPRGGMARDTTHRSSVLWQRWGGFANRLAVPVVLGLLGFAGYSFVSIDPVHPITGLATVGGFFGAGIGVAVGRPVTTLWTSRLHGSENSPVESSSVDAPGTWFPLVALGTGLAFVFPTMFRVGGARIGPDQWVFGSISGLEASVFSVGVFVVGLWITGLAFLIVRHRMRQTRTSPWSSLARLTLGLVIYALMITVATGFASRYWYQLLPATSG